MNTKSDLVSNISIGKNMIQLNKKTSGVVTFSNEFQLTPGQLRQIIESNNTKSVNHIESEVLSS